MILNQIIINRMKIKSYYIKSILKNHNILKIINKLKKMYNIKNIIENINMNYK